MSYQCCKEIYDLTIRRPPAPGEATSLAMRSTYSAPGQSVNHRVPPVNLLELNARSAEALSQVLSKQNANPQVLYILTTLVNTLPTDFVKGRVSCLALLRQQV